MKTWWILVLLSAVKAENSLHRPEENVGIQDNKFFEGDMILTDAQRMSAMLGEDVSKAGLGRASIRKNLWPSAVLVYQLDPQIERNSGAMSAINNAIKLWQTQTCVRFKKRSNERNHVYIHIGDGCTSYVGRIGRGRQMLSLARGCWHADTVAHEFGRRVKAKTLKVTLGNRKGPTDIDVKQMNLLYKCSGGSGGGGSDKPKFIIICEGKTAHLTCTDGQNIRIEQANYGRQDKQICNTGPILTTNCKAGKSLGIVQKACLGKARCVLNANNSVFGDPCYGTYKYLAVQYSCQK
ncbi:L-rhamnose-binding lectin CSL1-like [Montipora capricornis]|uniref:L-rhamnose-binding lectin CSL1-like n=1 Tax=Montipora capricornis TaxID=246305 RepID=UPI0035F102D3